MLRRVKCKHCVGLFQPIREGHFYCSSTCRKLAFKAKKRAENNKKTSKRIAKKLEKLTGSSFGKYLLREIRRAGTVQILEGHTASTLAELVALKRKCTAASGYENGACLGTYELSHIYPVRDSKSHCIGLLNAMNLTIAPRAFNRKHATTVPVAGYLGTSINRRDLQQDLAVSASDTAAKTIGMVRKFIGKEFDLWLDKHVITTTQRQALVRTLEKAGFSVEKLQALNLEQLKAMAADEDVAYFHITQSPVEIHSVIIDELDRLQIGAEFLLALKWLDAEEWGSLDSADKKFIGTESQKIEFKEFLVQQSLCCLHGQPFVNKWRKKKVLDHFKKLMNAPYKPYISDDYDEIL